MTRKTVLITGASNGIGAATALMAAQSGFDIAVHYNSDLKSAEAVAQHCQEEGAKTFLFQADISKPHEVSRMFAEFDAACPQLDALVNNAGIVDHPARVDEMTPERLQRMVATNLVGPMLVAKEAVLRMSTAYGGEGGAIVNLSSAAAKLGSGGQYVDYAATKAGIDIFTKGLADEVAAEGVRVNAVRPGIIDTEIHGKGGLPDRAREMAPRVPMKRAGGPEEVASGILYLLSDLASYVTGTTLDITGGR